MRAKIGLAIRVEIAHQRASRATMVPIKARTNRILKDRAKEPKSSERGARKERMRLAIGDWRLVKVIGVMQRGRMLKSCEREENARPWGFEPQTF